MDAVYRFLFEDLDIRGALVQLGPAWHDIRARREYAPPVRDLLGGLAAVTALIGSNLKRPGRLTFQLQGHGPVRMLVMDCDEQLRMRGMAKADAAVAPGTVEELLGDGNLTLTLQTNGSSERPYQSLVPIEGETLTRIFENYLALSEQTPTRLWLVADDRNACGLFLQKLPDADLYDHDGWNRVTQMADTLQPGELALAAEVLLRRLFPEETIRLFDPLPVSHHCPRDEEKVLGLLRAVGREEVEAALKEYGAVIVRDDICNHEYRFGPEVVAKLFATPKPTLH
jgi:molecular chaperone Hsp33